MKRKTPFLATMFVALTGLVVACSSSDDSTPLTPTADAATPSDETDGSMLTDASTSTDASAATDAAKDGSTTDASGACNSLTVPPPLTTGTAIAAAAPAPTGGTVANGTYVVTAINAYTGAGGDAGTQAISQAIKLVVSGSTWQYAYNTSKKDEFETATVVYSGTNVAQTFTCPASTDPAKNQGYSASATELRIYDVRTKSTTELVLTKQP